MSMTMTNATLRRGDQVKIKGKIPADARKFWIGLGTGENDQAVNISSSFSDGGIIVLNSCIDGWWGAVQKAPNPLEWGTEVEIVVKVGAQFFELNLPGGQVTQFGRRANMEIMNWIKVEGGLKLSHLEIC